MSTVCARYSVHLLEKGMCYLENALLGSGTINIGMITVVLIVTRQKKAHRKILNYCVT